MALGCAYERTWALQLGGVWSCSAPPCARVHVLLNVCVRAPAILPGLQARMCVVVVVAMRGAQAQQRTPSTCACALAHAGPAQTASPTCPCLLLGANGCGLSGSCAPAPSLPARAELHTLVCGPVPLEHPKFSYLLCCLRAPSANIPVPGLQGFSCTPLDGKGSLSTLARCGGFQRLPSYKMRSTGFWAQHRAFESAKPAPHSARASTTGL